MEFGCPSASCLNDRPNRPPGHGSAPQLLSELFQHFQILPQDMPGLGFGLLDDLAPRLPEFIGVERPPLSLEPDCRETQGALPGTDNVGWVLSTHHGFLMVEESAWIPALRLGCSAYHL